VTDRSQRQRALKLLKSSKHHSMQLDFIALALRGKKAGFDGVITMIDGLVGTLNDEQTADDKKKVYCGEEIGKADEKKKGLERTISDTKSAIGKAEEDVASLAESLKQLTAGIKAPKQRRMLPHWQNHSSSLLLASRPLTSPWPRRRSSAKMSMRSTAL